VVDNNSVAIIVFFFGPIPWYLSFFLKSVSFNPSIDFLLVTDQNLVNLPGNLTVLSMSLSNFQVLAETTLGCKVELRNSHLKVCDIRPAFGIVFQEFLQNYDFWGYCDVDLIFGNIRSILDSETLSNYSIISARPEYLTGFFSLFRNNEAVNNLFRKNDSYLQVFGDYRYLNFDECDFKHVDLWKGKSLSELPIDNLSMTHLLKEGHLGSETRVLFDLLAVEFIPGDLEWNSGTLVYGREYEALLYHLIQYKNEKLSKIPHWETIPDRYIINKRSFSRYPYRNNLSLKKK